VRESVCEYGVRGYHPYWKTHRFYHLLHSFKWHILHLHIHDIHKWEDKLTFIVLLTSIAVQHRDSVTAARFVRHCYCKSVSLVCCRHTIIAFCTIQTIHEISKYFIFFFPNKYQYVVTCVHASLMSRLLSLWKAIVNPILYFDNDLKNNFK
jgi:hypothetical protein